MPYTVSYFVWEHLLYLYIIKYFWQKGNFSGKLYKYNITSVDIRNTLIKLILDKNRYIMNNSG